MPIEQKNTRWWQAPKAEMAHAVGMAFKRMDRTERRARYAAYLGLYEARNIGSLDGTDWVNVPMPAEDQAVKENVLKSIIDTATAKIATSKPRAVFCTTAGDFEAQKKAKQRGLFVEGVIHEQGGYAKGRLAFRDGAVMDQGILKFWPDDKRQKVRIGRVLPSDVVWDVIDGKYGEPRTLMQFQQVSRSVLAAMYAKGGRGSKATAQAIAEAGVIREMVGDDTDSIDDPVHLIEAWHLPSGPDATDGRHVICTSTDTLVNEEWTRERYPLLIWRWKTRMLGFDGMGVIEDVVSQQKELDWLGSKIQMWLNSLAKRGWIEKNSAVAQDEMDTSVDGFNQYTGQPPVFSTDPGPNAELYMERDRMKAAAFEQVGLSQLSAQSKKPAGLQSGRALLEYKDTESERFQDVGQDWDAFWVAAASLIIDAATDLAESSEGKSVQVRTPLATGDGFEAVKMTADELKSDQYMVQVRPASMLPREPAGRVQTIENLMGMFPQAAPVWARYLDYPDVADAVSLVTAPIDAILADIEQLQEGKTLAPEPFLDLETAKMLVLSSYLRARNMGASEAVQRAHRDYLASVQDMLDEQAQMLAAQAAPVGLPGPGAPPPALGPGGADMPPGGMPPGMPPDMGLPPGVV